MAIGTKYWIRLSQPYQFHAICIKPIYIYFSLGHILHYKTKERIPYIMLHQTRFQLGHRLRNFEIRVGIASDKIGNNAICYKQLRSMEPGVVKKFACYQKLFGNWISINKTEAEPWFRALHFREISVYSEHSKSIHSHVFDIEVQWNNG